MSKGILALKSRQFILFFHYIMSYKLNNLLNYIIECIKQYTNDLTCNVVFSQFRYYLNNNDIPFWMRRALKKSIKIDPITDRIPAVNYRKRLESSWKPSIKDLKAAWMRVRRLPENGPNAGSPTARMRDRRLPASGSRFQNRSGPQFLTGVASTHCTVSAFRPCQRMCGNNDCFI